MAKLVGELTRGAVFAHLIELGALGVDAGTPVTLASDRMNLTLNKSLYIVTGEAGNDDIDGIDISDGNEGQIIILRAATGETHTLKDENAGAAAAEDRLRLPGGTDVTFKDDEIVMLYHDPDLDRWILIGPGSGGAGHAESHDLLSHSTNPQLSDVFCFVGTVDTPTIVSGVIELPAAPFGLTVITGEGGADDDLDDIEINGGGTTLVPGTMIYLTNTGGDAITLKHNVTKIFLSLSADVTLNNNSIDLICLYAANTSLWVELWRSPSLMPINAIHGVAKHTGKIGEVPVEIHIVLANPIVSNADTTLLPGYEYKDVWGNAVRKIRKWYIKFGSALGGSADFALHKNGSIIAGSKVTVNAADESAVKPFDSEVTLADGDVLTVVQDTTTRTDAIQGDAYVFGREDVVDEVTYS